LRLRYQGSADRWNIGIYLASDERYTESELPTSFGPKTGTPEQGIDHTFILYAGPSTDTTIPISQDCEFKIDTINYNLRHCGNRLPLDSYSDKPRRAPFASSSIDVKEVWRIPRLHK
jgi:hypothetical protein